MGDIVYKELNNSELDNIFLLHEMRWKRKYDISNFSKKKHQEFYLAIAKNSGLSFHVRIYGLMLGNRLIAFTYGFQCNGTYYFYRISHDDDFSVFSPGKIILMKTIEECFENDIRIFDFGLGCARYKSEWTDDKKSVHEFVAPIASGFLQIFYYKHLIRKIVIKCLKKIKFYDTIKLSLLGITHCLFTGVYYREIIQSIKKEKVKSKISVILKKVKKNLYSKREYMIYKKSYNYSGDNNMIKVKSYRCARQLFINFHM